MQTMLEKLTGLMAAVGPIADFPTVLQFDGEGAWAVAIDERTLVELAYDDVREVVVLSADLGVPPAAWADRFARIALEYGSIWRETDGTAIMIDPVSGGASALCAIAVSVLDERLLIAAITSFAERVAGLREIAAGNRTESVDISAELAAGTLMRV